MSKKQKGKVWVFEIFSEGVQKFTIKWEGLVKIGRMGEQGWSKKGGGVTLNNTNPF